MFAENMADVPTQLPALRDKETEKRKRKGEKIKRAGAGRIRLAAFVVTLDTHGNPSPSSKNDTK